VGGRCNFTNLYVTPDRYVSANPHFCKSALSRFTQWDFIALVEEHGIEYFEKETVNGLSGQLFCHQSSKLILAMLLEECRRADVSIKLSCEIEAVMHPSASWVSGNKSGSDSTLPDNGFHLQTNQGDYTSEALVVASGGLSVPSLGGSGIGYELAQCFGLRLLPTSAGLVPFTLTDAMLDVCHRLAGVSTEAVLFNDRQNFREDLLFTHRGISGPAVLQLSSHWHPGEPVNISLLPDQKIMDLLLSWKSNRPRSLLRTRLDRVLPRKLVIELEQLWWPELADTALAEWPDIWLEAVAQKFESWSFKPAGTEGYRTAEVTLGGIDTRDLSSRTMESDTPGLFFIGEVLDVTGQLGGFNFQWAWSSGVAAGEAI